MWHASVNFTLVLSISPKNTTSQVISNNQEIITNILPQLHATSQDGTMNKALIVSLGTWSRWNNPGANREPRCPMA